MTKRLQRQVPNWLWLGGRAQTLAVLALVVGGILAAVAGVSTAAPVRGETRGKADRAAVTKVTKTISSPVNGDARAADEPPSRLAVAAADRAEKAAATIAPAKAAAKRSLGGVDRPVRKIMMEVTAYCACKACCGPKARGITASGKHVSYNGGKFVAADTDVLPFGTKIIVPGYNRDRAVPVADRGGAIVGRKLDLYFPSHKEALKWGRQWVEVTVME